MRILLVRLGSLGDIVHALPAAAALRKRFPDARMDWLVDARYASILELVPIIDGRVVVARGRRARRPADVAHSSRGPVGTIRYLRRQRYDVAVDFQGLLKSALFARLSGARRVVGFDRRDAREGLAAIFYSERCGVSEAVHVVDKNLGLLGSLGIVSAARQFPLDVPPSLVAEAVLERGAQTGPYVLVNPGAAWPNKRWPPARFAGLAAWLHERHGLRSVVIWGPGERELASSIAEASAGAATLAPPTNVGDLLAIARGARLVVSGDTGPLHIAAAVGAPIVGLFGPTDPARNGPWDSADVTLSRFGDCVCHYERRCRRRHACIEDISLEDVQEAIDRRLAAAAGHA